MIMHKHHIIPKHMGGSDDPSNIAMVTVEEHAKLHRELYEKHGHWEDRLAWLGLSKMITKQEIIRQVCIESAKKGARRCNHKRWGTPLDNPRTRKTPRKPGIGTGTHGRKWYHNPITNERKSFLPEEVIPDTWIAGTGKRKKKNCFWFTNGIRSGQFSLENPPNGWRRGRSSRKSS